MGLVPLARQGIPREVALSYQQVFVIGINVINKIHELLTATSYCILHNHPIHSTCLTFVLTKVFILPVIQEHLRR